MPTRRRKFLGLAGALLAAPFASLRGGVARAGSKPPLRFLTVMDTYGLSEDNRGETWVSSSVGDYALQPADLGTVLRPFENYLDQLLVVSGLRNDSSFMSGDNVQHASLVAQALTGSRRVQESVHSHESIDVRIGTFLNQDYGLTAPRIYPHLNLADVGAASGFCYDADGFVIPPINANNIVSSVFGADGDPLLPARLQAQSAVMDVVRERIWNIRPELINANRDTVIDAYEDSVDALSQELELRANLECVSPAAANNPGVGNASSRLVFDAIYNAFACELASSITYSFGGGRINQLKHGFLNSPEYDAGVSTALTKNMHQLSHRTDPEALFAQVLIREYQSGLIAGLLDRLASTPDVDGSMMLDNTVVYVGSKMSDNVHGRNNYALAVIAGANANLRGGYHYDCSTDDRTNCDFLTTLARGLFVPEESFGGFDQSGAPIAGIHNGAITAMLKD